MRKRFTSSSWQNDLSQLKFQVCEIGGVINDKVTACWGPKHSLRQGHRNRLMIHIRLKPCYFKIKPKLANFERIYVSLILIGVRSSQNLFLTMSLLRRYRKIVSHCYTTHGLNNWILPWSVESGDLLRYWHLYNFVIWYEIGISLMKQYLNNSCINTPCLHQTQLF